LPHLRLAHHSRLSAMSAITQADVEQLAQDALLEEELVDVPEAEMEKDSLYRAEIKKTIDSRTFTGIVSSIDRGMDSGEVLYLVEYNDGEVEHYTAEEVKRYMVSTAPSKAKGSKAKASKAVAASSEEEVEEKPKAKKTVVSKRPVAVKAPVKAVVKVAAKAKAKAKGKAMKGPMKSAAMKSAGKPMKGKKAPVKAMKGAMKAMKAPVKAMKGAMKAAKGPMKAMKAVKKVAMKAMKKAMKGKGK